MENNVFIRVVQVKSSIRCNKRQHFTLRGLGLNKIGSSVVLKSTSSVLGMVNKVKHLISFNFVSK